MSTDAIGLKSASLRPEMEKRLLDREVREERPENTDDGGEEDRGVEEVAGLSMAYSMDAIGRAVAGDKGTGVIGAGDAEDEDEKGNAGNGTGGWCEGGRAAAGSPLGLGLGGRNEEGS